MNGFSAASNVAHKEGSLPSLAEHAKEPVSFVDTRGQMLFASPSRQSVPAMEIAARFHAARLGSSVGGDFYDVIELGDGRCALVLGGVCISTPTAAAVKAVVKHGIRGLLVHEKQPGLILGQLNAALVRSALDRFCTVALVSGEWTNSGVRLTLVRAGHLPPLVLRRGGEVEAIRPLGAALGYFPDETFEELSLGLGVGESVVLYSDGLLGRETPLSEESALAVRIAGHDELEPIDLLDRLDELFDRCDVRRDATALVARVKDTRRS